MANGWVYFIRSGDGGPIKIGYTGDIDRRLTSMQTDSAERLTVLGVIFGPHAKHAEGNLHRQFAASRLNGEWFEATAELLFFIASRTMPLDEWRAKAIQNCVNAIAQA